MTKSGQATSDAYKMPELLRQAVAERFKESPLTKQFGTAAEEFLNVGPQAREDVSKTIQGGTILSPTQQQAIIAAKRAAGIIPVMSINDLLKSQFGASQDLVNAGTGAYNAYATGLQNQATLARQKYEDILNRLVQETQLNQEQQRINKSGGSGGMGLSELVALVKATQGNQTTTEGPSYSPVEGAGSFSDDGGWYFDGEDWIPVVD